MLKIPYGESNFASIREQGYLYVDKTHFIEKVERSKRLIHLRPRRFGKSLFLSMLDSYYDVAMAPQFDELFEGLYVHGHPTGSQNSYYMLRFNFSGVQNTAMSNLEQGFLERVKDGVKRFIGRYNLDIKLEESASAASLLSSLISSFEGLGHPEKIYILIDEYDHFTNSVLNGDGAEFLDVLRRGGFVHSFYEVIKEKAELGVVDRFFITGVMSVTLDSMTSGFNIASNITIEADFADMMGFTSDEVKEILRQQYLGENQSEVAVRLTEAEQTDIFEIFKSNYNGYQFSAESNARVFNSTLIMYYLERYLPQKRPPRSLVDVNLNQSGATIESIAGLKNREQNYKIIEEIVSNGMVEGTLQPFTMIDKKFDRNDLITLLFNLGLLTIKGFDFVTQFMMPNRIIENIYMKFLSELVQKQSNFTVDISKQQDAINELGRKGEISGLTELVSEFLSHTSNRNTIQFDEKYIKLAYMMLLSYSEQFSVYDEFPSRQGYCDLFIKKASNSAARYEVLIELKYIKKGETTKGKIEAEFSDGIHQAEAYMQDTRLAANKDLRVFVVVFSGFDVVKLEEVTKNK